jgi:hypothetical protein
MAKTAKKSGPKKAKRNVPNGVAHIQSTFNNTIVSISDTAGEVIAWSSAGASGFKALARALPLPHKQLLKLLPAVPLNRACVKLKSWFADQDLAVKLPSVPFRSPALRSR